MKLPEPIVLDPPELTVDVELWRSLTAGVATALGRKRGLRLVRAMANDLAERVSTAAAATPLHGDRERYARETEAKAAARATFQRELDGFLAALEGCE